MSAGLSFLIALAGQDVEIRPAPLVRMPGVADSNSPAHWQDGKMFLFNSVAMPIRSEGWNLFSLGQVRVVLFSHYENLHRWIEATWRDPRSGRLYAWYHHEPGLVCADAPLTAPLIGAAISDDNGLSFQDLGIVLSSGDESACDSQNGYFAGGHGDFSVIADERGQYFYFYFGNYGGPAEQQGIAVARVADADLDDPVGKVWKFADGEWNEPGLGGRVTPAFPARVSWQREDTDSFWGPSLHFNTALGQYVMLMTRSCCHPGWPSEGTYVSFNRDAGNPAGWTSPRKLLHEAGWYPQILGLEPLETDKRAGAAARLFVGGESSWEIYFSPNAPAPSP